MIEHKLSNKTKSATLTEPKLFHQLNNPYVRTTPHEMASTVKIKRSSVRRSGPIGGALAVRAVLDLQAFVCSPATRRVRVAVESDVTSRSLG
jgi:hypothetical protein